MFEKQARQIIDKKTLSLETIEDVRGGNCLFNFMCHKNAVDFALKNKQNKLAMVMYKVIGHKHYSIHFINITKKGNYIDNTIGIWALQTDYKLIKIIKEEEFWDIDDIFNNYIDKINLELPFYIAKRITF